MIPKGYVRNIVVPRPSLPDNTADAQRLEQCLKKELGCDHIVVPIALLKRLPSRLRSCEFNVKTVLFQKKGAWMLLDLLDSRSDQPVLGAAIDIGSTRVVICLVNLETGEAMDELSFDNPQIAIGPDILSRVHYSGKGNGLSALNQAIIEGVNIHLAQLCRANSCSSKNIYIVSGAGNTAMTHLFLGIEVFEMIKEPYIPCVNIPDTLAAGELGLDIHPNGAVFLFPNIGAYFGGDLIAGILYADLDQKTAPCLMVDVGTNAEIVVGDKEFLIACAGAAGPALEGGISRMGMTAGPGVIDKIWVDPDTRDLKIHAIDNEKPIGICGSGMIDLAAALFLSQRIDIQGKFSKAVCKDRLFEQQGIVHFILVDKDDSGTGEPICLSQVDLNSLTSSKAAMYTILEVIVKNTAGLEFETLDKFYVAGTFGSFINPESAISIGMLPDIELNTFEVLGNSSLGGAKMMLKSPEAFERTFKIRQSITYVELNVNQEFMNMFSGAKFYPHTDTSRFPSLKSMNPGKGH